MLKRAALHYGIVFALCACILSGCSDSSSSDKDEDSSWNGNSNGTNSGNGGNSSSGTDSNKIILHAYEFTNVYVWNSENEDLNRRHFPLASEGDGWYKITLDAKSTELLFSNPYEDDQFYDQTLNFEQEAGEWWFLKSEQCNDTESGFGGVKWNGMWYSHKPSVDGSSSGGNEGGGTGNGNNGNEGGSGNVSSGPWTSDIYLEIMMFAREPTDFNDGVLVKFDSESAKEFKRQLSDDYVMEASSSTALNYAFHKALINLSDKNPILYNLPEGRELRSVNIITFTDGVDNASGDASKKEPWSSKTESLNKGGFTNEGYGSWIKEWIDENEIAGQKLSCYPVGVKGTSSVSESLLKQTLANITSGDAKYEILDEFDKVKETFSNIVEKLVVHHEFYTINMYVPADVRRVKMDFGNDVDNIYFEGDITHDDHSDDFKISIGNCSGLSIGTIEAFGQREIIYNSKKDKYEETGRVCYVLNGLDFYSIADKSAIEASLKGCKQSISMSKYDSLIPNDEYEMGNDYRPETEHYSTAIYLILDATKSLGDNIDKVRDAAIEFIDVLAKEAGSSTSVQ